jgi:hypothetical protein
VTLTCDSVSVYKSRFKERIKSSKTRRTGIFTAKLILLAGFVGVTAQNDPGQLIVNGQVNPKYDPSYGGIFTTPKPYVHPDEYNQPEDKQDQFDWKLTKV